MSLLLLPSLRRSRWSWGPGAHEYLLVVVIWKRVLFLTYYHDWRHFIKIDQPGLMQDWRLWIGDFTLKKSQFVSKNISQPIIQAASRRWVSSLTEWCRRSLVKPRASKMWGRRVRSLGDRDLQGLLLSERWHILLLPPVCSRWDSPGRGTCCGCVWGQPQKTGWGFKQTLGRVTSTSSSVIQGETGIAADRTSNIANLETVNEFKDSLRCYFALGLDMCVPACLCMRHVCAETAEPWRVCPVLWKWNERWLWAPPPHVKAGLLGTKSLQKSKLLTSSPASYFSFSF